MSLLGRLEDLSLPDIIQIVHLSRRTGILEIVDGKGRHTVLFRHGLIVNASSPESPDLLSDLLSRHMISPEAEALLRRAEEQGKPIGSFIIEQNLLPKKELGEAIRARITSVVSPLLGSRDGEFNFILSDSIGHVDMEYDPDLLFDEGGFAPQKIVGGDEKVKPLRGLEESLKAGKALLRAGTAEAPIPSPEVGVSIRPPVAAESVPEDNVVPFPAAEGRSEPLPEVEKAPFPSTEPPPTDDEATPFDLGPFPLGPERASPEASPVVPEIEAEPFPPPEPIARRSKPRAVIPDASPEVQKGTPSGRFKVAGGLVEVTTPETAGRHVVLFERNPLIRVAARRAFGKKGITIAQYGSLADVQDTISELLRSNSFFVTFLDLTPQDRDADGPSTQLLQRLKRRNSQLPVVMIDDQADLGRRHCLLRDGADLYLTKPSEERLQPGLAEEELALFADELVLFVDRAFEQWGEIAGSRDPAEAGRRFYEHGEKQQLDRSFSLLKQLINELSNPNDISQVAETILRFSGEYVDRGVLFVAGVREFRGVGGFGIASANDALADRAKSIRIPRSAASILEDVVTRREGHRGKIRRTPANVELIERLGGILPTEVLALPIMHEFKVIGILYGDNAEHRAPIDATTGLEIFLSQAGYAFGNAVVASRNSGIGLDQE